MSTKYIGSDGKEQEAETMTFTRLDNKVKKMERMGETDGDLYPKLLAVRDARKAAYEAEHGTEG